MRPCLPLLALLLPVAALSAQTAPVAPRSQATVLTVLPSANCPVRFAARRWNDSSALRDVAGKRTEASGQGVVLRSEPEGSGKAVLSATVVVRGSAPSLHLSPAGLQPMSNQQQTFHLAELPRESDGSWKLVTDRVPLIQAIDVTEIRFAGGSVWHAAAGESCRFQPDSYLPVASLR